MILAFTCTHVCIEKPSIPYRGKRFYRDRDGHFSLGSSEPSLRQTQVQAVDEVKAILVERVENEARKCNRAKERLLHKQPR